MVLTLRQWLFLFSFLAAFSFADPYQILGVSPEASEEEIKKAYLKKARAEHPDVSPLPKTEAERRFKEVQKAWEDIQRTPRRSTESNRERQLARETANTLLEKAWEQGAFGPDTFESLPRKKLLNNRSPLSPFPNRSPKDDGEWEAVEDFLSRHQAEIIQNHLGSLPTILRALDTYTLITGKAVQSIRAGFTAPFEQAVFESTDSSVVFLETLRERLERLNRSGHFLQSPNPKQERERAFGNTPSLYAKKFGSQPGQTPEIQLAKALLNQSLEGIRHSPIRIHELDFLIRSIPPLLAPEEQLGFLSTFLQKIPSTASDLRDRIEKAIQKTFSKNPELAQKYSGKATFWRRLTRSLPDCDLILGRLARQK